MTVLMTGGSRAGILWDFQGIAGNRVTIWLPRQRVYVVVGVTVEYKQLQKMGPVGVYSGTIPTRFLTLLAHFIILIILLWDKVRYSL